jgi:hypothetical protein
MFKLAANDPAALHKRKPLRDFGDRVAERYEVWNVRYRGDVGER